MRAGIAIVCVMAGCGFRPQATPGDGAIEDATDAYLREDAIDGAANLDTDQDGVNDNVDNCVTVANPDQHDEDADNVGDACDPCPQVANAITDGDSDGIPDACDPHPSVAGDALKVFVPFTGTALPQGWTVVGSTTSFVVAGDVLTINATGGTQFLEYDTGNQRHAIDVGVELPASTGGTTFFTALTDLKDDTSQYFGCGLRIDLAAREFFRYDDPDFTTVGTDPAPLVDIPVFPHAYRIRSVLGANNQACEIPGMLNRHLMTATQSPSGESFVGLRAGKTVARVRYVAVYTF